MTVASIITDALRSIPPKVRKIMLIVYALTIVAVGIVAIFGWTSAELNTALLVVGGYLGVQSAANVTDEDPED
jgi:type IV secretory pathway VirB2 component (pilin)